MAAVESLNQRLMKDPWEPGEPLYTLHQLNLQVRLVIISPLVFDYGVHLEEPFVVIKGVTCLSGYQLD